jgi:hypothetical protein
LSSPEDWARLKGYGFRRQRSTRPDALNPQHPFQLFIFNFLIDPNLFCPPTEIIHHEYK